MDSSVHSQFDQWFEIPAYEPDGEERTHFPKTKVRPGHLGRIQIETTSGFPVEFDIADLKRCIELVEDDEKASAEGAGRSSMKVVT